MSRPDPIPFDTHRFVKRLTQEGMPAGQAAALADEQVSLLNSNLATRQDLANCATKQDVADIWTRVESANFATRDDLENFATKQDFAVLKSEVRTLKWVVAIVGVGMLTVMLGMSSLLIRLMLTV